MGEDVKPTATLSPCPFCGGEAEIERRGDHSRSTIYRCTNCSCSLETGEEWGHGRDWNRRVNVNSGIWQAHEGDIYADAASKLWRVKRRVDVEPVVLLQEIEQLHEKPMTIEQSVAHPSFKGFKKIYTPPISLKKDWAK